MPKMSEYSLAVTPLTGAEQIVVVQDAATLLVNMYEVLTGMSMFWGASVHGARSELGGGIASALAQTRMYSSLSLGNGTSVSMAGHFLHVSGTLTISDECVLHNDGSAASGSTGGVGAPVGWMAAAAVPGANGGAAGSNQGGSSAANAASPAVGGAGGAGGAGANGAGGAAPTVTLTETSHGLPWSVIGMELMQCLYNGNTYTKFRGGAGGAGGGSSTGAAGGGGGGGGGLGWIRAKNILNTGRISCRGGAGAAGGTNAGGGGGGGGGLLLVWCDTWAGTPPDANGGIGGVANGTGAAGSNGSPGKVLVFVRGELRFRSGFGGNAPDINSLPA